jgi:hypothetical protein
MSLFTIGDTRNRRDVFAIRIPAALSILSYNRPSGEVKGINDIQAEYEQQYGAGDYVPNVFATYWTFRAMVGAGFLMLALATWAFYVVLRDRIGKKSLLLTILPFAIALPYLANSTGWILTEMGRQPWIVFGLLLTEQGVSNTVPSEQVLHPHRVHSGVWHLDRGERVPDGQVRASRYGIDRERRRAHDDRGRRHIWRRCVRPALVLISEATMELNTLWFMLIGVLFTGFFILEGFDYGVGILLPFLGKTDEERRQIINTIGPWWDGNEVWLLTAGGAMFAAFPNRYATLFSGFYLALFLMLVGLILRGRFRTPQQGPASVGVRVI